MTVRALLCLPTMSPKGAQLRLCYSVCITRWLHLLSDGLSRVQATLQRLREKSTFVCTPRFSALPCLPALFGSTNTSSTCCYLSCIGPPLLSEASKVLLLLLAA